MHLSQSKRIFSSDHKKFHDNRSLKSHLVPKNKASDLKNNKNTKSKKSKDLKSRSPTIYPTSASAGMIPSNISTTETAFTMINENNDEGNKSSKSKDLKSRSPTTYPTSASVSIIPSNIPTTVTAFTMINVNNNSDAKSSKSKDLKSRSPTTYPTFASSVPSLFYSFSPSSSHSGLPSYEGPTTIPTHQNSDIPSLNSLEKYVSLPSIGPSNLPSKFSTLTSSEIDKSVPTIEYSLNPSKSPSNIRITSTPHNQYTYGPSSHQSMKPTKASHSTPSFTEDQITSSPTINSFKIISGLPSIDQILPPANPHLSLPSKEPSAMPTQFFIKDNLTLTDYTSQITEDLNGNKGIISICTTLEDELNRFPPKNLIEKRVTIKYELKYIEGSSIRKLLNIVEQAIQNIVVNGSLNCSVLKPRPNRSLKGNHPVTIQYNSSDTAKKKDPQNIFDADTSNHTNAFLVGMNSFPLDSVTTESCYLSTTNIDESCAITEGMYTLMFSKKVDTNIDELVKVKRNHLELLVDANEKGFFDNLHPNITEISFLRLEQGQAVNEETSVEVKGMIPDGDIGILVNEQKERANIWDKDHTSLIWVGTLLGVCTTLFGIILYYRVSKNRSSDNLSSSNTDHIGSDIIIQKNTDKRMFNYDIDGYTLNGISTSLTNDEDLSSISSRTIS